jgi:hypothetical protein
MRTGSADKIRQRILSGMVFFCVADWRNPVFPQNEKAEGVLRGISQCPSR